MLYLATASGPKVREAMLAGRYGLMNTPASGYDLDRLPGVPWAADNGCFSERWTEDRWLMWLTVNADHADSCLFAVVPDVVGDHAATLDRWVRWAPVVRQIGYPLAFVLQDGAVADEVPWGEFEWLFIGGTDTYKLSPHAREMAVEARRRGKGVHMGRVNSQRRCVYAAEFCDTADGTFLAFGPDVNLPRLDRYLRVANHLAAHRVSLFDA